MILGKIFGNQGNQEKVDEIRNLDLNHIIISPFQPRKHFDEELLKELSQSIRDVGIIQPIVVRRSLQGYELVAGERRMRACKMAGFKTIPAIIKELDDKQTAELALIENLQRSDLNFFEEAEGYLKLLGDFNLTQEELAHKVGKSQSAIANKLRLLKLSPSVQAAISPDLVSERHVRALLKLSEESKQLEVLKQIYENDLTVRQVEELINGSGKAISREIKKPKGKGKVIPVIIKDLRIFVNTIHNAVGILQQGGIQAVVSENQSEDGLEIRILVPKNK